jgi:DNA polymerase I-like protein with 3'-5' exonuclease and polymerase domains
MLGRLSDEHRLRHGVAMGLDQRQMCAWLFDTLKLPAMDWKVTGRRRTPSLDKKAIARLLCYAAGSDLGESDAAASLRLIQQYRQVASLLQRLRSLGGYVDGATGRIHSAFDDVQASGRVSSRYPNLQQLAKARTIAGQEFRSRNALRATAGYELAAFDIAQADIRVLAAAVESFPHTSEEHLAMLRQEREDQLGDQMAEYGDYLYRCRNPEFVADTEPPAPAFRPGEFCQLADDFRTPGDFYSKAVERTLGRPPAGKQERNRYKPIVLAIVNGKGPPSLARDLDCTPVQARDHLNAFGQAYPQVMAYQALMYQQIAWTGRTTTFAGRPRTLTAHRWLMTRPLVEILVSYRGGDAYWLEVVPLRPSLRVLTTFVRRAWNARTGRLIYDHQRGRLSGRAYRLFDDVSLLYRLPVRNWSWRSIRRVRTRTEEAVYEGFDATARAAFNFICQGGTADLAKLMMLRSQPVCARFGARLLLQIHDELVFEAPKPIMADFLPAMQRTLEEPPWPGFRIPIVVEPKWGEQFGALRAPTPSGPVSH